ncbi:MAG: isoprenylcysteine carboxylmethyltransferase family protein [Anaerolineales bacterium]
MWGELWRSIGCLFAIWSIVDQLTRGRGTPLPVMATQTLLISGPFAHCRNPMSFGTIVLYSGLAIWVASWSAIGLVTTFTVALITYLKCIEEKELEMRFGQPYIEYKRTTPFIIPSLLKK